MIQNSTHTNLLKILFLFFLLFSINAGFAQTRNGSLKGYIIDASTNQKIYSAKIAHSGVSINSIYKYIESGIDGSYTLETEPETYTITYSAKGFQTKQITGVVITESSTINLDVFLYPTTSNDANFALSKDSLNFADSVKTLNFNDEKYAIGNLSKSNSTDFNFLSSETIQPYIDKNAAFSLQRLPGLIIQNNPNNQQLQTLTIRGMGQRYNQVLLNGALLNSFDANTRTFALDFIPTEVIENISLTKIANTHTPADFSGGSVNINTKEFPEQDFIYAQAGAGFSQYSIGKPFLGDKRGGAEFLGFAGKSRDLPSDFPNHKSEFAFNQFNAQEQVRLSKTLSTNLAYTNFGKPMPNSSFILGYGKTVEFNGGQKLGLVAYVKHNQNSLIEDFETQALPDVANNPYPFSERKLLVKAQSINTRFISNAHLGGFFNATLAYNKSKISFKNTLGSMLINNLTVKQRYKKYDENLASRDGINYFVDDKKFWISQLSGTHGLGDDGNFKLNWIANYTYFKQKNPDDRNFLLQHDTLNNKYQLANTRFDFINSNRRWTETNEKSFFGDVNISIPFNLLNHAQVLSGGINIQSKNKLLFTDLLMYKGGGFTRGDSLLATDRYFTGGVELTNYFRKDANLNDGVNIADNNKGNYSASSNIGASYIKIESKITDKLNADFGFRLESSSNLVSNIEFRNTPGFKFPQQYTMNENSRIVDFNLLPSLKVNYKATEAVNVYAVYYKSLNRPHLQELSQYRSFDTHASLVKVGNPLLSITTIDNVDLGVNIYKLKGASIGLAGYYKKLDQPIENVLSSYRNTFGILQSTPFNMPSATVLGAELSVQRSLEFLSPKLRNTTFFANANYTQTKVAKGFIRSGLTPQIEEHTLSGSPNYSINSGITYNKPGFGAITILYNSTGDYVTAVGSGRVFKLANGNSVKEIPDYVVRGTNRLNVQISKKVLKSKAQIIFGVNNIFNQADIVYQDLNGNKKFDKPVILTVNDKGELGYLLRGVDNTVLNIRAQPMYYFTFAYNFN